MSFRFLHIILGVAVCMMMSAKPAFRTVELERLAKVLNLNTDQLKEGYSHPTANGLMLIVHLSDNTIDQIGLHLFADELRQIGNSPVFDFLERYFLQLKYPPQGKSMSNMLRDDQFRFIVGNVETVSKLKTTDAFSFNYDNHLYEATWTRNNKTLLAVSFPVEYELISGENKIEAEENLKADVCNTQILIPTEGPVFKNDKYISDLITNKLYTLKGKLVLSKRYPAESAANVMLCLHSSGNYQLNINQIAYGFKKIAFNVPLKQWISFCLNHGCELYFGVDKISESGDVDCVVIAVNQQENYNHVLTVTITAKAIESKNGTIEARLYPYVPTHNVRNMFAAFKKSNHKKAIVK